MQTDLFCCTIEVKTQKIYHSTELKRQLLFCNNFIQIFWRCFYGLKVFLQKNGLNCSSEHDNMYLRAEPIMQVFRQIKKLI